MYKITWSERTLSNNMFISSPYLSHQERLFCLRAAFIHGLSLKPYWRNPGPKKKKQTLTQGQRAKVLARLCSAWNLVNWTSSCHESAHAAADSSSNKSENVKTIWRSERAEVHAGMEGWSTCTRQVKESYKELISLWYWYHYNQYTSCQWKRTALHWKWTLSNTLSFRSPNPWLYLLQKESTMSEAALEQLECYN